jgi:hypothetical protein
MTIESALMEIAPGIRVLLILALANLLLGVLHAIKEKAFDWAKLADWIPDYLVPVLAWAILAVVAYLVPEDFWALVGVNLGAAAANVALGTVGLMMATGILGHLAALGIFGQAAKAGLTRKNGKFLSQFLLPIKTPAGGSG